MSCFNRDQRCYIEQRDNALWGLIMGKEMSRMKTVYVYAKLFGTRERCSMLDWVN